MPRTTPVCAVANTLAAVDAGATHVRCTANGWGKPVGNANLFAVVAALQLNYGKQIFREGALETTTRASHAIAEVVGLAPRDHQPYGGASAHTADPLGAENTDPDLYQHVVPKLVGNVARTQASEADSRTSVELHAQEFGYDLPTPRS